MIYLKELLGLLFPRLCVCCGNSLFSHEEVICDYCELHLPRTGFHLSDDNPVSRVFWGRVNIANAAAFYHFNKGNRVQQLVHSLKYKGADQVGTFIGKRYAYELLGSENFREVEVVVPVPLHWKKLRKRGYNQSEVFAKGIAEVMKIPVVSGSLVRIKASETQTRKSRFVRWENVKDKFSIRKPEKLANKHILLVDDVITTGATLEACAQALLTVEGTIVSIATIAFAN